MKYTNPLNFFLSMFFVCFGFVSQYFELHTISGSKHRKKKGNEMISIWCKPV